MHTIEILGHIPAGFWRILPEKTFCSRYRDPEYGALLPGIGRIIPGIAVFQAVFAHAPDHKTDFRNVFRQRIDRPGNIQLVAIPVPYGSRAGQSGAP